MNWFHVMMLMHSDCTLLDTKLFPPEIKILHHKLTKNKILEIDKFVSITFIIKVKCGGNGLIVISVVSRTQLQKYLLVLNFPIIQIQSADKEFYWLWSSNYCTFYIQYVINQWCLNLVYKRWEENSCETYDDSRPLKCWLSDTRQERKMQRIGKHRKVLGMDGQTSGQTNGWMDIGQLPQRLSTLLCIGMAGCWSRVVEERANCCTTPGRKCCYSNRSHSEDIPVTK